MFLDTRDQQQLKVYANEGEYINVGASHVGLDSGFIVVINPMGDTVVIFNDANAGLAIINNNVQEMNGPIGTANGGYNPGVIQVGAGSAGVWTVIFDYPSYDDLPFPAGFMNILNNAPWTRAANQPVIRRVVVAWDVTITSGAPGNMGGVSHDGRLYSNEHISFINGNNFNTSPIFYVLTPDGYLYQVNFKDADPFRFPISSNSRGLVKGGTLEPVYASKSETAFSRSADPSAWDPNSLYLYEPQAEDNGSLINNKLFFNEPDAAMPSTAMVTDVFRGNTHETWLRRNLLILVLLDFYFVGESTTGASCGPWVIEEGSGGYFVFTTNLGGDVELSLDLNNNGSFEDSIDITIMGTVEAGVDSLFWNGQDGLGNFITIDSAFELQYKGSVRFGELHIAMTDVENNPGGVTFEWLNAPAGFPDSLFYYDHSDFGGPVSGGGTPGNALPTSTPFTYQNNFGNDRP